MATSGAVLDGAKASQTNSPQSELPTCGVARDFKPIPLSFNATLRTQAPALVDLHGSQYAASFLDDAQTQQTEYAVWAANSSQVALVPVTTTDANTNGVAIGTGSIPQGSTVVGGYPDGATYLNAFDTDGRAVGSILSVVLYVGGVGYFLLNGSGVTPPTVTILDQDGNPVAVTTVNNAFSSVDPDGGFVGLSAGALTALGGGVSQARGDSIFSSYLVLANQTFWWSKNDSQTTRFTYDGKLQKWLPIKGASIQNVGIVTAGQTYSLSPAPRSFELGDYLLGDAADADKFASIRVGISATATASTPLAYDPAPPVGGFSGVKVVANDDVEGFPFTAPDDILSGVVGLSNGKLKLNPAFITANAGLSLWYSGLEFDTTSKGVVAPLLDAVSAPLFVSPVPAPLETPLIRIGSRRYLTAIVVKNDAALLAAPAPTNAQVIVSLSTGRLRFSTNLPKFADPTDILFDPAYLGENVVYDGVACCAKPQPLRQPSKAVDNLGVVVPDVSQVDPDDLYLPIADPFASGGLGASGIFYLPDDTGSVPSNAAVPPARAGGDTVAAPNVGLVRRIGARLGGYNLGDDAVYWYGGAFPTTKAVGYTDDLPSFDWTTDEDIAYITEAAATGSLSQVKINGDLQEEIEGPLYYINALLTPAAFTTAARMVSRIRNTFTVSAAQTEVLYFALDGDAYKWEATTLPAGTTFTTDQMVTALLLALRISDNTPLGTLHPDAVYNDRGYLMLEGTTSLEVGFGYAQTLDLSGCRVTGFLPGWRAIAGQDNWLPDSGLSFGMGRSPLNLGRTSSAPDYIDRARTTNQVLTASATAFPYLGIDYPPLRDVVGYGDDVFFRRIAVVRGKTVTTDLNQLVNVLYDFDNSRFGWLEAGTVEALVVRPTAELALGSTAVIPDTMLGVEPNPSGGLFVAEANGPYQQLQQGIDYLLPDDGTTGTALLIDQFGTQAAQGYRGTWASGSTTFSDSLADFTTAGVAAGYLLTVYPSGGQPQTYTVASVTNATTLVVSPAFTTTSTAGSWQCFVGEPVTQYDRAVLADSVYIPFNPLPTQTFNAYLMSPLGPTPADAAAQSANRLVADIADAQASNRAVNLRFGREGATAALSFIGSTSLGVISNGVRFILGVGSVRYTTQSFSVLVGDTLFTHGGANLLAPVGVFSPNPVGVEYLTTTGELKFNATLLVTYSQALVYQVNEFLPPASLQQGQAEYDQAGLINISAADLAAYAKEVCYFEEALVMGTDMTVSPMSGSFYLSKPVRAYQLVKATYWQAMPSGELMVDADGNPVQVTEFLPFTVRMETATRVNSQTYSFDPPDDNGQVHVLRDDITPTVYVGPNLQNYGQATTVRFDYTQRLLYLTSPVEDATTAVRVSYAVFDAFGGERTFSVSTPPVFQPPFFLTAGVSSFTLAGDATTRLTAGQMLRLGASTFYLQSLSYDPDNTASPAIEAPYLSFPSSAVTGTTTVNIWPATVEEVGSRSPAQQALTLITAQPITNTVNGTTTGGNAGNFLTISTTFQPVVRGTTAIVFNGPVGFTTPAPYVQVIAGQILEVNGLPYTVADSKLSEDGTQQVVSVTAPFVASFNTATVRITARPVYPEGASEFVAVGPVVPTATVRLLRFGTNGIGQTLVQDLDWSINVRSGTVRLLSPAATGLASGEKLILHWTAQQLLRVAFDNGIPQVPRYSANYRFLTSPSVDNGLLGSTVQATYSFKYPDSFYTRDLPLAQYLGIFTQDIVAQTQQTSGQSAGPLLTQRINPLSGNGQQSLLSQRQTLLNQDRAARTFLTFYNDTIVAFEQVLEAIDGEIVGDRDGKFRFYTGDAGFVPAPGLTDPLTGILTTRNIYSEVWNAAAPVGYLPLQTSDRLVDPFQSFTLTNGVLEGDLPNAFTLSFLLRQQATLIRNDIDDLLLIKPSGVKFELLFTLYAKGSYERMADPNPFSRLFPEQSQGIMLTAPGLDANLAAGQKGEYSFANLDKLFDEGVRSTFLTQIAQVANNVQGDLTRLTSISVEIRTPRAWVWQFYPNGIPANALFAGSSAFGTCAICTVLPAGQVPTNPDTGYPDLTQFAYFGGTLPDLSTGEPSVQLPYWRSKTLGYFATPMQLEGGTPDGRVQALTAPTTFLNGNPGGLYVKAVTYGCVVTFADRTGALLLSKAQLLSIGQGFYAPQQGDTLRVRVRPDATNFDLYQTLIHKDNFDLYTQFSSGRILDLTAPFIINQTPAVPVEFLQARVTFTNPDITPTAFPALTGEPYLDNGDRSFPFLATSNTELDRFGQIGNAVPGLVLEQGPLGGYVYPDEILMNDGAIQPAFAGGDPPDTLLTAEVLNPVGVGEGPLSLHDLVLVQTTTGNPTLPASSLGFQTVGDYSVLGGGKIEVPRFLSRTKKGAGLRYTIENYMVSTAATLDIIEDRSGIPPNGAAGKFVTLFNLGVLGGTNVLDDGVNAGAGLANAGGLNTFIATSAGNTVRLRIFTLNANTEGGTLYDVGDIVEDILFTSAGAFAQVAGVLVAGIPQFGFSNNNLLLRFLPTPFAPAGTLLDLPALQALPSNRFGPIGNIGLVYSTNQNFGYSLSVSAVNPDNSLTASLKPDRLTFAEVLDFRLAQVRGTVHPDGGWDLQTKLLIEEVEAIDTIGGLHWISYLYLNGKTGADGCPFTFLDRDGTNIIGTFTPATGSGAGDEEGTLKVMAWEGVKPVGAGAVLVANVVAGQVTSITISNGGSGYFGGYVELIIASPAAPGRTATATATVVGGVITNTTIYLNGNGYAGPTAAVTVRHFAGNQQMASTTDIIASAIPSSAQDTVGNISLGTATIDVEPILLDPSADITRVQSGDIVTVRYADDPTYEATAAGGTYLVRHIVPPSAIGSPFVEFDSTATAGQQNQPAWVEMDFSTVVSWDDATFEVTLNTVGRFGGIEILDGTENVANTTLTTAEAHGYKVGETVRIGGAVTIPPINGTWTVLAVPSPEQMTLNAPIGPAGFAYGGRIMESAEPMPPHLWQGVADFGAFPNPATYLAKYGTRPRLYFVTSASGSTSTAISIEYQGAGSDPNSNLFRVVSGTALDTLGAALSDADFFAALSVGQTVSGRVYFPLTVNRLNEMPDDNVVGYTPTGQYGFQHIRFQTAPANLADYPVGTLTAVTPYAGYVMPNVGDIGLAVCIKKDSDRFILRRQLAVYNNVLAMLDLSGVANNHAGQLSGAGRPHADAGVACLVPNDNAITSNGGATPLRLTAGIFCEPSFPVSSLPVVGGPWVGGITAVSATNPAVVSLSVPHNLRVGDQVAIGGTARAGLNTTWTVAAIPAGNQFTVAFDNTAGALGIGGDTWGTDQPRLVDNLTSPVWLNTVGLRSAGFSQFVHYNVRRIRRFHGANEALFSAFAALRFAYETRRGIVTAYSTTSKQTATVTAANFVFPSTDPDYQSGTVYSGTQLGGFANRNVNIKAGDVFRLIDPTLPPSQKVVATATIKKVVSNTQIVLEAPALYGTSPVGLQFEVWLRNAVVPHQQSCDQLLDIVTDETLVDRTVNRTIPGPTYRKGGYVTVPYGATRLADYANEVNKLRDDLLPVLGETFADYGLQVGDIVLIDPQGVVGTRNGINESGVRPFGDISIVERGAPAYVAGQPAPVDDNRGFYRITNIDTTNNVLTVDGTTGFGSSNSATSVTYPKAALAKASRGYAVLPTVHNSVVTTTGDEGQVALRPTSLPGVDDNNVPTVFPDSYADCNYSVRPFAYRIIRPTGMLSSSAIDLILTMRERMLSLIEQFKLAMTVYGGDYYTFQKNLYGRDLGLPTVPSGSGVFSNLVLSDLLGQMDTVPFTNDSDCLSVLDRRFWVLDTRLDRLTTDGTGWGMVPTPPGTPYTDFNGAGSNVRPVLPDRIDTVLDYRDRLREQRFSWISYRVNRLSGSLAAIARFDQQYTTARAQQLAAMAQRRSLSA